MPPPAPVQFSFFVTGVEVEQLGGQWQWFVKLLGSTNWHGEEPISVEVNEETGRSLARCVGARVYCYPADSRWSPRTEDRDG